MITYYITNDLASQVSEIANINISLVDYISLEGDEKYAYLTTVYEKQQGASVPYGVDRFERLLKPFNLSEAVNRDLKQSINELAQTRNNLIHKAGVVDTWFMKQCGWLHKKYKIGDTLIVNHKELDHWIDVTIEYCETIQVRIDKTINAKV